jgi:uncharacterized protein (TIGR03000 family)
MLRRFFAFGGALLAAALVFLTPGPGRAAPRGGGFRGGFHGGFHGGGFHHRGWGGWGYGLGYGTGYGYPYYTYPYYSPHPYYYTYPYYPSYTYDYPSLSSGTAYDPGYSGFSYQAAPSYSDGATLGGAALGGYRSPSVSTYLARDDVSASLTVKLPAGALLWIEDEATTQVGPVREFRTPAITPGRRYTFDLRATWYDGRQNVTQTQRVEITGGAHVNAIFPVPADAEGKASAVKIN